MKLTRCSNGHFYDAEKYSSCPHCAGSGDSGTVPFSRGSPAAPGPQGGNDDVTGSFIPPQNMPPVKPGGFDYSAGNNNVTMPADIPSAPDDDGKTVGFFSWTAADQREGQTGAVSEQQMRRETVNPVVGWLVCIEGSNYGKAFNLYTGKNFIGRDQSMDVCLAGDTTISRMRHAIIVYEPKQRIFFAQPGDSHELFYCNDDVVLSSVKLHDRDVITIGKTVLKFVPFCDFSFGWGAGES